MTLCGSRPSSSRVAAAPQNKIALPGRRSLLQANSAQPLAVQLVKAFVKSGLQSPQLQGALGGLTAIFGSTDAIVDLVVDILNAIRSEQGAGAGGAAWGWRLAVVVAVRLGLWRCGATRVPPCPRQQALRRRPRTSLRARSTTIPQRA